MLDKKRPLTVFMPLDAIKLIHASSTPKGPQKLQKKTIEWSTVDLNELQPRPGTLYRQQTDTLANGVKSASRHFVYLLAVGHRSDTQYKVWICIHLLTNSLTN